MKKRLFLFVCAALTAGCLAAEVAEFAADPRDDGQTALKNRDWAKAERLLTDVLRTATTGQDELLLDIATAQHQAGKHDAAIATLDRLVAEHPASPLKMKAVFRKGDATIGRTIGIAGEFLTRSQMAEAMSEALGEPVTCDAVTAEAFRGLGFPGADDLGNMFQFNRDFADVFVGARNLEVSRELNPALQSFRAWLQRNSTRIPIQ